jgi:hypothetical protein
MSDRRPKKRRNDPEASLEMGQWTGISLSGGLETTYEALAAIHDTSASLMFKSCPMNEVMTVTQPTLMALMAMAMVAVATKRTSCTVLLKHSGRPLAATSLFGVLEVVPSSTLDGG